MARYQYGEIFDKLGVPAMGRIGSGWGGLNSDGVFVLMTHQKFYKRNKETGRYYYDAKPTEGLAVSSPSAARSLRMLQDYFEPGKPIILPVGVFKDDGGTQANGTIKHAEFDHATGRVYRATFRDFRYADGLIICDVIDKFEV